MTDQTQEHIDRFYMEHGPCCAGCDWWRSINSVAGECIRNAPVSGSERAGMLGISGCSLPVEAGHVMTPRNHHCGDRDGFDWSSLPPWYLRKIAWSPHLFQNGEDE